MNDFEIKAKLPMADVAGKSEFPARPLPDTRTEADLFWRVRVQTARTTIKELLRTSRLRTLLVVVLSMVFWAGLFALFYLGFYFLLGKVDPKMSGYHDETIQFVFHLFFASLNVMLVFSAGIILYSGLFSSDETRFLLTLPASPERIVLHKYQEAILFSSWGFFLLASPLTVAYGIIVEAPWHYYVLIAPLILSFVWIPCGIGAMICMLLIYKLSHIRLTVVAIAAAIAVGMAGWAVWDVVRMPNDQLLAAEWFQETMRRFSFSQEEWLPSTWLCRGLFDASKAWPEIPTHFSESPVAGSLVNLLLLVSNALMCHLGVYWIGKKYFRTAFSELECRPKRPRFAGVAWVDRLAAGLLKPFPTQVRLLLIKDWRLLRRDPVQWSQFLIFFALLGLYFLNLDRFSGTGSDFGHVTWVNMVSFLNLAVVGLILSTFTTRFIYPMLSLEGSRFWVLGLMPIRRDTIVWSKFVFAALGSWFPCALLILLSDLMLQIDGLIIVLHQYTTILLCFGLAALAVGLGATMPNFREPSPSKIAAGFGGTLNLVLSALYIFLIVILTALPCHFYFLSTEDSLQAIVMDSKYIFIWMVAGTIVATVLGVIATLVPMRMGIKAFRSLEFS